MTPALRTPTPAAPAVRAPQARPGSAEGRGPVDRRRARRGGDGTGRGDGTGGGGRPGRGTARRPRRRLVAVLSGDRPMLLVLVGAVVLGLMLLVQPLESYLVTRERVLALEAKEAALDAENRRLERRAAELTDAETIELLAREQQGFVRPGEVPYVLVPPDVDRPRITAPAITEPDERPDPWALLLALLQRLRG